MNKVKKKNIGKVIKTSDELLECIKNKEWIVWTSNFKEYHTAVARAYVNRTYADVLDRLTSRAIFRYIKNK